MRGLRFRFSGFRGFGGFRGFCKFLLISRCGRLATSVINLFICERDGFRGSPFSLSQIWRLTGFTFTVVAALICPSRGFGSKRLFLPWVRRLAYFPAFGGGRGLGGFGKLGGAS